MVNKDSISQTLIVTIVLSLICSVLVSGAAVALKSRQDENKTLDIQQNILSISGLVENPQLLSRQEIQQAFETVKPKIVNIKTGKYDDSINIETFDQKKASKTAATSRQLKPEEDSALIKRQEHFAKIFVIEKDGELDTLVLPVRGYGLWSTLYGFIAIDSDFQTVVGIGFYDHAETPGLGGEVDNPKWKAKWKGKEAYDKNGNVKISVIKGTVNTDHPNSKHLIDGLSGASLTSRGVSNLIKFWLGDAGFKLFLQNLKNGEA